jgi:hypothetical protein
MTQLNPDTAWRRIVLDSRYSVKARVMALEQITRPAVSFLRRLLSAKDTPRRLRLLATQKYALEMTRAELTRNAQNPT